MRKLLYTLVLLVTSIVSIVACIWVYRAWDARSMPALEAWHTFRPAAEFSAADYPQGIEFTEYQALEAKLRGEVSTAMSKALSSEARGLLNRYDHSSISYPGDDGQRWNYSYELSVAAPEGGMLLIHGASDSPYSVLALARQMQADGLHVVVVRLPGNGTVPGGLAAAHLDDWTEVTRMGVRRAAEMAGPGKPVYIGGYSIGSPLTLDYVLDALIDDDLVRPSAVFLYSPAIAVSRFAQFASWDVLLSKLPFFRQFAWLSVEPEYDPYKYNSFAKNAGDIAYQLTSRVHRKLAAVVGSERGADLPPMIAFQSVVDATVDTEALVNDIFRELPANGSELVLFDVNRMHLLQQMLIDDEKPLLDELMHGAPNDFAATLVTNRSPGTREVVARTRRPGSGEQDVFDLQLEWPDGVYSLSHVAIPFPPDDPWYGSIAEEGALTLGTVVPRGEKNVLRADINTLMRIRYNPFFEYVAKRTVEFRRSHE